MEDLKILLARFNEHEKGIIMIRIAAVIGAASRAAAFHNGWLG